MSEWQGSWGCVFAGVAAVALFEQARRERTRARLVFHLENIQFQAGRLLYEEEVSSKEEAFERAAMAHPYCRHPVHPGAHRPHAARPREEGA